MNGSRDREVLKGKVKSWMGISGVDKQRDALDMTIIETFFYIYYGLTDGLSIQEIGNDLGVFPVP